ncbi:MAG: hypothetical protein BHW31_02815 [Firmicutes bacterium CAG:110_56_8]|nr:MAG: hypothetical protein BHW31_02815 [Firmicutes bacterium CAG:110_56_8]
MKTPCQRLLSLLLVFVLVLSLIPSVYAADNDESTPTEPEATETTASTESPTTTPPQSDPSEETEGSSAGAPDSQPDNEYGIATTASTSAGVLLFDYADHGNYTTVLNSQVSVTYKPNGTGSAKTAYIKNLGWHFARYNNIAYADDPLYCIEPYKNYAASTSGNSVDRDVTLTGSGSTAGATAWYSLPEARRKAIGLILLYSDEMWDHSISVTTTYKDDNPNVPLRIATQFLIYEIVCGLRDPETFVLNSANESGTAGNIFYNAGAASVSYFAPNYNTLVSCVQAALKIPSFTSSSSSSAPTITLTGDETSVYDSNGVLSGFSFTNGNGAEFRKSGNTLYISQTGTISESTVFKATKTIPSAENSAYSLWYMSGSSYQTTINLYRPESGTLNAYFKLKGQAIGNLRLTTTTEDGKNLSGWKFGIYSNSACTSLVSGPHTTDSSGRISVTGLTAGTYYVKELGHTNSGIEGLYVCSSTNPQKVTIINGSISVDGITPGTYYVKEIGHTDSSVNEKYVCSGTNPQKVTSAGGAAASVTVINKIKTGNFSLTKTTSDGLNLAGWEFGIYSDSGCTTLVSGPHTTDSKGAISVTGLEIGTYYVKELGHRDDDIEAMYSCASDNPQKVTITYGTTASVSFHTGKNLSGWQIGIYTDVACTQPIEGSPFTTGKDGTIVIDGLSPQKLYAKEIAVDDPYWVCDSSVKAITVKANATVSVTFSNTHNGDLRVKKNAVDGSPEGWNFQILDADRELVETITTGEDGYAASSKLEPGTYYVVEIHDRDETYWTYDAVVEKQVTITAGTQSEVEYTNEQFGILVFCKTTNTGNQLGGWTFRVQDSDGNVVGDYTTDETGYASTGKLKPGSYTVLELSNGDDYWNCELGYHSVTIIAGKATEDAWHNREQGLGWFHKSTNTGESLEGWEITIYSDKECTQKVTTVTTNADGKVGIYLDPGIYYARESGDTEGRFENEYWLVDESIKEFEILPHKDVDITFVNTQYGKIKVIKSMPSSGSLEGWTFIVRDINGDEIKGSPFITDASGLIVSENLYPGTYAVEEVIPDDSPYICVSENPQSVTVVQGRTAEVRFTNSLRSGKIAIRKVDTTGEPLAGAEFLLEWSVDGTSWLPVVYSNSGYAKEGTCSSEGLTDGRLISDKTGLVEFAGLHPERLYRLTETAAPDGFQLLADTAYEGGLPDDKEYTVDLTVVNVRTYELPETGSKSLVLMPIA